MDAARFKLSLAIEWPSSQRSNAMSPKEPHLEASVFRLAAHTAAVPVSKGVGVEESAPPVHGFLRWLDNWFRTSPEERMRNDYMAYWS
jgi:hypothetical protein